MNLIRGYLRICRSHRWRNLWGNSSRCLWAKLSTRILGFTEKNRPKPWPASWVSGWFLSLRMIDVQLQILMQGFCTAYQVCQFEALIFSCRLYSFCSSAFRWLSEISRKRGWARLKSSEWWVKWGRKDPPILWVLELSGLSHNSILESSDKHFKTDNQNFWSFLVILRTCVKIGPTKFHWKFLFRI